MEKTKLSKYLFYLFVASIIIVVCNFLSNYDDGNLSSIAQIVNFVTEIFYLAIIWKMSSLSGHYRTSAIFKIISIVLIVITFVVGFSFIAGSIIGLGHHNSIESLITSPFNSIMITLVMVTLVAIISSVISIIAEYHEFQGHSELMIDYDSTYTVKWKRLWKFYFWSAILVIVGLLIWLLSINSYSFGLMSVGLAVTLLSGIASIVCGIFKIIYLYRMSKIIENYDDSYIDVQVDTDRHDDIN